MRDRASQYGIDADRVAMLGSSAGGHLAALLAMRERDADRHISATMKIGFRSAPAEEDDVIESRGARLFVAHELADALGGRLLDVNDDAEPPRLVLRSRAGGAAPA